MLLASGDINRREEGVHRRSGQRIRENLFERESNTKHLDFQPVRGTGDLFFTGTIKIFTAKNRHMPV